MIDKIIALALEEDTALGDITSENIFTLKDKATARLVAKKDLILCGVNLAKEIFEYVDRALVFKTKSNVKLFFDDETFSYECTDIDEVRNALEHDLANATVDPMGAAYAYNLLTIMTAMDYAA